MKPRHFLANLPASQRGPLSLSVVLFLIVLALLALMYAALHINDGLRAYTKGSTHWSVSRLEAIIHLERYIRTGEPDHFAAFENRLQVTLGDRQARLAMETRELHYQHAYDGLLAGENHPEDIPGMIRLYRWFNWHPNFRDAIDIWESGDEQILALKAFADNARETIDNGEPDRETREALLARLAPIDQRLHVLEGEFVDAIAYAARHVRSMLALSLLIASALLVLLGGFLIRRISARTFEAEARFRRTFEDAPIGIFNTAPDGTWVEVNASLSRLLGHDRETLIGAREEQFLHPQDRRAGLGMVSMMRHSGLETMTLERLYRRVDGEKIPVSQTLILLRDIHGQPLRYIGVTQDLSESRRLAGELAHQVSHDELTGLINRYEFERRLQKTLRDNAGQTFSGAVLYLDLDQFKVINDTCGHTAGDAMLVEVTDIISRGLSNTDLCARFGGDEFVILVRDASPGRAETLGQQLLADIRACPFEWDGQSFSLGASIGIVPLGGERIDASEVLSLADTACHAAKESGRNQIYVVGREDVHLQARHEQMNWISRLQSAMSEDRLFLVWQPIIALGEADHDTSPARFEVLVRLNDENGEVILPGQFVVAAERFGQVAQLDNWVISRVLRWLRDNPDGADRLEQLSINISGASISDPAFLDQVREKLADAGPIARKLCFEITETAMVSNMNRALEFMEQVGRFGCHFSLDDFGIGVSSFAYLHLLPVEGVKIDGSFVRDLDQDPVHYAIVRCINDVAHATGQKTVAEFVESRELLSRLRGIGCDYLQGYAVGEPVELGRFERRVRAGQRPPARARGGRRQRLN